MSSQRLSQRSHTPFALVVLDGWGWSEDAAHNAIERARTPCFDRLRKTYPHALLQASEEHVGLPEGQIGNSEIGHMTIGAGRVIDTDLVRITKAMRAGAFATNPAFAKLFAHCKTHGSTLHVIGLLSPGGIHSHSEHLYGFLNAARDAGINDIAIHVITDGRDTPPQSAADNVAALESYLAAHGTGRIASVSGRFFAMDRDNNWDRLEQAEAAMFCGEGRVLEGTVSESIRAAYAAGALDEHFVPAVCKASARLKPHDGVFLFNFRSDRMRMLERRLGERSGRDDLCLVTMTRYAEASRALVAFPPSTIDTTLAAEVSRAGLSQAHIAETEKYPHATYFLNGGRETPHPREEQVLIESRKDVPTHDLAPEMRAKEITDAAIARIENGVDFIFINYANADMVGHTANVEAIVRAVETVDRELARLMDALEKAGGRAFVTADHGNAEQNIDPQTGEKHTAHTLHVVPAILTSESGTLESGTLADIAPTVLAQLGLAKPSAMTGRNLYREF